LNLNSHSFKCKWKVVLLTPRNLVHGGNPDFLKIDSCLDSGGRWNYQENICENTEKVEKHWHVSPSNDPLSSTIYPVVLWENFQKIKIGMDEKELKSLIGDIQNYHHPVNAIVYTSDQNNINYEVAIKLSTNLFVEDLSFKKLTSNKAN